MIEQAGADDRRWALELLRGMSQPDEIDVTLELQHPDATVSGHRLRWPAGVRLPVAGDALRLPDIGVCIVGGVSFRLGTEVDAKHGDPFELAGPTITATVIADSDR